MTTLYEHTGFDSDRIDRSADDAEAAVVLDDKDSDVRAKHAHAAVLDAGRIVVTPPGPAESAPSSPISIDGQQCSMSLEIDSLHSSRWSSTVFGARSRVRRSVRSARRSTIPRGSVWSSRPPSWTVSAGGSERAARQADVRLGFFRAAAPATFVQTICPSTWEGQIPCWNSLRPRPHRSVNRAPAALGPTRARQLYCNSPWAWTAAAVECPGWLAERECSGCADAGLITDDICVSRKFVSIRGPVRIRRCTR